MVARKISIIQLDQLVKDGNTVTEIARKMNVTPGAVSKQIKNLSLGIVGVMATSPITEASKSAPVILQKTASAMDRLMGLIDRCDNELKWIEATVPPAQDDDYRGWQDQKIKHAAEIRKLISTMADIRTKLYQNEKVEKALRIIIEEVRDESQECQKRIVDRLERAGIHFEFDG